MLQRQRVILERRIQIGLRQVPCVASLGEKAKIGQPEVPNQPSLFIEIFVLSLSGQGTMK